MPEFLLVRRGNGRFSPWRIAALLPVRRGHGRFSPCRSRQAGIELTMRGDPRHPKTARLKRLALDLEASQPELPRLGDFIGSLSDHGGKCLLPMWICRVVVTPLVVERPELVSLIQPQAQVSGQGIV